MKHSNIYLIKSTVAAHFEVPIIEMECDRRAMQIARVRHIAMYLCCKLTGTSLPEIGRRFGKRDHTTVAHGRDRIKKLMKTDPDLQATIESLEKRIVSKIEADTPVTAEDAEDVIDDVIARLRQALRIQVRKNPTMLEELITVLQKGGGRNVHTHTSP